ncbi:MAG: ABC transporter ATP-binding protein [Spirochaetaceae bacterium]
MVEVKSLYKKYGDKTAVNNISFKINQGEIFGIMGPNGAGKSTTLECILGTKKKDSGDILILGEHKIKKEMFNNIGVQFQESSYQANIRVSEICEFTSALYNIDIDYLAMLEDFNLLDKKSLVISSLSGGERQKLSILLASIHSPELLFLDELTTGLDPIARRETWKFIKNLNNNGTTIIITSHFMDEVEFLCDRGFILKNGVIKAEGSIDQLVTFGKGKNLDESYINILEGVL